MSGPMGMNSLYSSPLSPRSSFRKKYVYSPTRFEEDMGSPLQGESTSPMGAYKFPGTVVSYIGGLDRTKDSIFKNAPGAPPQVSPDVLGPFGLWKGTRFGYILAAANDNSRRALKARGYNPPPPELVQQEVDKYWAELPRDQYDKLEKQLQALSEEQDYQPPSPRERNMDISKKGPRSVSGTRGYRDMSPLTIKKDKIRSGYDKSYKQEYDIERI